MADQFRFSVKPLPKPVYEMLKTLRQKYGLTTWQVVILIAKMAVSHAQEHPEATQPLAESVVTEYPDKKL